MVGNSILSAVTSRLSREIITSRGTKRLILRSADILANPFFWHDCNVGPKGQMPIQSNAKNLESSINFDVLVTNNKKIVWVLRFPNVIA